MNSSRIRNEAQGALRIRFARLALTNAMFADRAGGTYPTGIAPDVHEESDQAAQESAGAWLREQPSLPSKPE